MGEPEKKVTAGVLEGAGGVETVVAARGAEEADVVGKVVAAGEAEEADGTGKVVAAVEAEEGASEEEEVDEGEDSDSEVEEADDVKVEAKMAERYGVPIELLRFGYEKHLRDLAHDCIRVLSSGDFTDAGKEPALAALPLHMYIMPYLPPIDAGTIKDKLSKAMLHKVELCNPDLLNHKDTIMQVIRSLESKQPLSPAAEPDRSLLLGKYRRRLQDRLLVAYALQGAADGNMAITHSILKHAKQGLYRDIPKDLTGEPEKEALMERINEIQETFYADPQEDEIEEIKQDLLAILATEDWKEQRKIFTDPKLQRYILRKIAAKHSLIGAVDSAMTASALERQLRSLISSTVSKGLLGEDFVDKHLLHGSVATRLLVNNFCENGDKHIDKIITLLEQKEVDFTIVMPTAKMLRQSAKDACARKVETMCEQLQFLCQEEDDMMCIKKVVNIKDEFCDIHHKLKAILELQSLIQHYDPKAR